MDFQVDQQCHGYKNGHQLLAGSIKLPRTDQDVIDRLSDISGPLRPGEQFSPYLTSYPLPSSSHYVLAKTWPDLEASRAGCVLTRSLIIPMNDWENGGLLASLAPLLVPVEKKRTTVDAVYFDPHPVLLPPVSPKKTFSLIEAIFLEDRQPIVVYDEVEADLMAQRLLSAFWPSLRRTFSVCTGALSPRSIAGRSFDLMFAPRSARPRFADWEGRVIEQQSGRDITPRHRWTATTAEHIFVDDPPSLLSLDTLGVLRLDQQGDEANLRLALLWNELLEKSERSPTAVLGLLDILNSREITAFDQLPQIMPLIRRGVDLAQSRLSSSECLKFLFTLLGKFTFQKPPANILNKIQDTLSVVTRQDSISALESLEDAVSGNRSYSSTILTGIADGVSSVIESPKIFGLLLTLRAEDILGLIAYSRRFADTLMLATTLMAPEQWTDVLVNALGYPDDGLRLRSRENIVPSLRVPSHAPLLSAILRSVDTISLIDIVTQIGNSTKFEVEAFDDPLRLAVHDTQAMLMLREVILLSDHTSASDRFLLTTLNPSLADIEWLFAEDHLASERKGTLLIAILSGASDREIQYLAQYTDLATRIESTLVAHIPVSANILASILMSGNPSIDRLLHTGSSILPHIPRSNQNELFNVMLSRGLSSAPYSADDLLRQLINLSAEQVNAHKLVALLTPSNVSAERLSHNIIILNQVGDVVRNNILVEIDTLTDRLIAHNIALSQGAIQAWSKLLIDAGNVKRVAQIRAAGRALSYALSHRDRPVSPIIVATFPIIYAELGAGKDTPNLFFFFFTDWDRCKTARHDLIRAFLTSNWPPIDLVRAVMPTGDLGEVFQRLTREKEGRTFLSRLRQDVEKMPSADRKHFEIIIGNAGML